MTEEQDESDFLAALSAPMPSKLFTFSFHRNGQQQERQIRVRILTSQENMAAIAAAQKTAQGKELGDYGDIYREAMAQEVLWRAVCHPPEKKRPDGTVYYAPVFPTADYFRSVLSEPEQSVLLGYYTQVKAEFGPVLHLGENSMEELIAKLRGPMAADFLGRLDSLHYPALVLTLAAVAGDLSELLGLAPTNSPDTSGSDQSSSTGDTGASTSPPAESSPKSSPPLLTPEERDARLKEILSRNPDQ